MVKLL
ncbi:hypothetical protein D039_5264A, partial [Vibrio parahaemolyticus EKP-028]